MRAVSLLGVLVFAKALVIAGHQISPSLWTPVAFLWQDVLFVMLFAVLDAGVRRPWFGWPRASRRRRAFDAT